MKQSKWRILPVIIALAIFSLDFLTKYLTQAYLPRMNQNWLWYPYGGIGVFKNFLGIEFSISHQINHGAAWGIFKDYQLVLLYVRMALIGFLLIYTLFFNKNSKCTIPLAMITAGAVGNVVDYFLYGHVIDMIHFVLWGYDFPVFNIADSAIFLGICWMLIASSVEPTPENKQRK